MELFLSHRSLSLRSLESGFHMIAIIAAIAELSFIAVITAMVAIIWKPGFREPEKLHISTFCSPLGFRMIATIAVIAAIAGKWFPYDRYDRCDHCGQWKVFSIWSLWSLRPLNFSERFLLLILEKWMIHRSVLAKRFEQNYAKIYIKPILFVYFFFSHPINSSSEKGHSKIIYRREFWRLPSSSKRKNCVHQT